MNDAIEIITGTTHTATLYYDQDAGDPRKEWDFWGDEDVSAYESGDVFGIVITHSESNEHADSCWGFYGWEYAIESANEMLASAEAHYAANEFDTYRDVAA